MRIFIILTALLLPFSVRAITCDAGYQLNYSTKTCVACPTGTYSDGSAILLDPNIIGTSYDTSPLSTGDGTWSTEYSYGTVSGIASCNSTTGTSLTDIYDYNFEAGVSGPSCWCKMTSPANSKWIRTGTSETNSLCAQYCASTCGRNRDTNDIRKPMYNSVACQSCTNAPANAHYTGAGTTATNCTWTCDAGYAEHNGACEPLCTAGITSLRTSTGLIYNLYANKLTSPAIHIQQNGITCYVNLTPGGATGAINVRNNGTVYHATN